MFKSFWGSQEQQDQPRPQDIPTSSWYPPSVFSSSNSSRPATPTGSSTSGFSTLRPVDQSQTSLVPPSEAAGIVSLLKDKSLDELRKLLSDRDAYHQFLFSLDQVKTQNRVRDELQNETLQLARENLEKEPRIMELRNQCRIIRTTELASALEKLSELEIQKNEMIRRYSPASLLQKLQDSMRKNDEESERLQQQLMNKEVEIGAFVQKHKKLRNAYHRNALTHLAAKTLSPVP